MSKFTQIQSERERSEVVASFFDGMDIEDAKAMFAGGTREEISEWFISQWDRHLLRHLDPANSQAEADAGHRRFMKSQPSRTADAGAGSWSVAAQYQRQCQADHDRRRAHAQ